jgi:mannose-1-phosphate guanylyltransferase
MQTKGQVWSIVLAAGEGRRLSPLTTIEDGVAVPKQYWRFRGQASMLRWTIDRAARLVPAERIVPVVARDHRRWWQRELDGIPAENVVVQPANRGTAAGILLPLLNVLLRDPDATVMVLPSDHFVEDEDVLAYALAGAVGAAQRDPDQVILLGMRPDAPEHDYGWILPAGGRAAFGAPQRVDAFLEKPGADAARALLQRGALWNSFVFAASARALVSLFCRAQPELFFQFASAMRRGIGNPATLDALYRDLPVTDFSKQVLAAAPRALRVITVPACGWTDLGTPARVARWLEAASRGMPAQEQERARAQSETWNPARARSRAAAPIAAAAY